MCLVDSVLCGRIVTETVVEQFLEAFDQVFEFRARERMRNFSVGTPHPDLQATETTLPGRRDLHLDVTALGAPTSLNRIE